MEDDGKGCRCFRCRCRCRRSRALSSTAVLLLATILLAIIGGRQGLAYNPWVDSGIAPHGWAKTASRLGYRPTAAEYVAVGAMNNATTTAGANGGGDGAAAPYPPWTAEGARAPFEWGQSAFFSPPTGFLMTSCAFALVNFLPHERGSVTCFESMAACRDQAPAPARNRGAKGVRVVEGNALVGFDLGWRSFQHDIINAVPTTGMGLLHPAIANNPNVTLLCAPMVCRLLSGHPLKRPMVRVDFQTGGSLCVERLHWAIVNNRPHAPSSPLSPSASSPTAESSPPPLRTTTTTTTTTPGAFPAPYNTTADTVPRGAFSALVDPYKRSIGIDPARPPGNLLVYVSRFVSSANRRVVNEQKVARALQLTAEAHGFDFYIWNKTTGNVEADVKVWAAARVVAGVHGGGLSNAAFLHPDAALIEAAPVPSGCMRFCFAAIAFSIGVSYHHFASSAPGWFICHDYRNHKPISLNPREFAAYVGGVLNATRLQDAG